MSRSKKLFLLFAAVFLAIMLWVAYDMASRTTPLWKDNSREQSE